MAKRKSSISKASSYEEMGEFWDTHGLGDYWSKTRRVKFDVMIESEVMYYPVEKNLSEMIQSLAKKRGVSSNILVNLLLQQTLREQLAR